ncbi:MAG: glycerol-3-phosphate dehydrogenase/oxidase [Bryobacteraceae bacterium]|nr:glycerol-3-phosphate dehydrogenase/oxidase [Bryobacteraceae bacterium]
MRQDRMAALQAQTHDILILGGGVNGAGIARDLALRAKTAGHPLKVALIDKGHFSSGTSGRNSQLIHGGLRYLKYMEFGLVREALRERSTLLEIAPHLVEPLAFLIPMYSQFAKYFYGTGLWMYDTLAGSRNISPHRGVALPELAKLEPGLNPQDLVSAAVFWDARVHSARFVLENLFEAEANGAVLMNYLEARSFTQQGDVWTVGVRDGLTGAEFEVRAKRLVNTTGPWAGEVWPKENSLRLVRGSHIILPRLNRSDNAIAYFEENGRIIFFIPWGSKKDLTLVGTTDVDHDGSPDHVEISEEETAYLLKIAADIFPESRGMRPIATYSALRPLVQSGGTSATSTSREHRIWASADGVVHVAGGKYTTYRSMSEEAADLAAPEALKEIHATATVPLNGNSRAAIAALKEQHDPAVVMEYGVRAPRVLERARELGSLDQARIAEAVECEWVEALPDLMQVSTYWAYERAWDRESLRGLARELGSRLGWNESRVEQEVTRMARDTSASSVSATPQSRERF